MDKLVLPVDPAVGVPMMIPPPNPISILVPIGNLLIMVLVIILIFTYLYSKIFKKTVNYIKILIIGIILIVLVLAALYFFVLRSRYY